MHIESFTVGHQHPIITFNGEDKVAGRLWQEGGKLHFEGNAHEAANMLFKELVRLNNDWLVMIEEQNNNLHAELLAMEHERDHWKNNHNVEVRRARVLKNRTDLPVERKMLYEALRLNAVADGTAIPLDAEHVVTTPEALDHVLAVYKAAQKLVNCKGRYHAEQNYRALAAVFGRDVPEFEPLDGDILQAAIDAPAAPTQALRELMGRGRR